MVEKVPRSRAVWDAFERALDKGVVLPAPDRIAPMTTEAPGRARIHFVVASVETYSEVRPLSDDEPLRSAAVSDRRATSPPRPA